MRKRIVSFLLALVLVTGLFPSAGAAGSAETDFTDITDEEKALAAAVLRSMGIISGTTETTFSPDAPLKRSHVCKIIVNAMGLSGQVTSHVRKTLFSDVLSGAWHAGYVNLAYDRGIINGYGDGTFRPDNYVTYGQLAAILLRMLGYTTAEVGSVWPTDYTRYCETLGITGSLELDPYAALTRGQAAVMVYNALQTQTASGRTYYETISGAASTQSVIVLDTDAANGSESGLLMAAVVSDNNASVRYYAQENRIAGLLAGYSGVLLLTAAGRVMGFLPEEKYDAQVQIGSVTDARLTDRTGAAYEMADGAVLIVGETGYDWDGTGYLQAACYPGSTLQLYYDDRGEVRCAYLPVADAAAAGELAVKTAKTVILLDPEVTSGYRAGQVMTYAISGTAAAVEYYDKAADISRSHAGMIGELLLNGDEEAVGFLPAAGRMEEVTVSAAKIAGIVDADGAMHRVSGSAVTIVGEELYTWKDKGYLQFTGNTGKAARLYYDDGGAVTYVHLVSGSTTAETGALVASTNTVASEMTRAFGISGTYSITKNGAPADASALARYDVVYYDAVTGTLRGSDYQISGYIQSAQPGVSAAETITVSGCEIPVLEAAWETLEGYSLGDWVTLLLTDDGKAAAVATDQEMVRTQQGVLSADGKSVTLLGSGLVLTGEQVEAEETLRGKIVDVSAYSGGLRCYEYTSGQSGMLDMQAGTLGGLVIAPFCEIYECAGNTDYQSYVYSLAGEQGKPSYDFSEVIWTDHLSAANVFRFRTNTAGQVDMIVLFNVTGNCYEYGKVQRYTGKDGIREDHGTLQTYSAAAVVTNSAAPSGSRKHVCVQYVSPTDVYNGVALCGYDGSYEKVAAVAELTEVEEVAAGEFFLYGDAWYVTLNHYETPVSDNVEVYVKATGQWLSGEDGLRTAVAMGGVMDVYYDRTMTTGAQVRVVVVRDN